jgi:pimeloyl-ACP methyl ester carboxylesterase
MRTFRVGPISFNYLEVGMGVPFVFQHGIGGDLRQPAGLFSPPEGVRLLSFDARAHGQTFPLDDPATLTFDTFGDDLVAFLDHLAIARAVIGGISMGAGVALNVAVRYPERVAGLVLSRPAWLAGPMPDETVALYAHLARLLRLDEAGQGGDHGVGWAQRRLERSAAYRTIAARSPDTARSLRGQLTERRARDAVARLERLPRDRPIADLRVAAAIDVPTLVLAHHQDPIHRFEFGQALAQAIPGAHLVELTPKSVDQDRHAGEVQRALAAFLEPYRQHVAPGHRDVHTMAKPSAISLRETPQHTI